jgi:hypothetical protein
MCDDSLFVLEIWLCTEAQVLDSLLVEAVHDPAGRLAVGK